MDNIREPYPITGPVKNIVFWAVFDKETIADTQIGKRRGMTITKSGDWKTYLRLF